MKHSKLVEVFTKLIELDKRASEYLDTIPNDIAPVFFDNDYVNSLGFINDLLVSAWTGDDAIEQDINWFRYEWQPGFTVDVSDKEYKINDLEDFFAYMLDVHEWDVE